ncbi:MAG TPA: hypothetical protein VFZ43_09930 [Anaerolineales bacterium]
MRKTSIIGQPLPIVKHPDQPYPPSWIDRLNDWVDRLPVSPWLFYLCLWLLLLITAEGSNRWLEGVQLSERPRWIYVPYSLYGVYFLAAIHYLDTWAQTALNAFRSTLVVDEAEQALLFYQLTTMPARTVWLLTAATLASVVILTRPLIALLLEAMGLSHHSVASTLVDLGLFYFNALIVVIYIYHTLRQLRWVSRIHQMVASINIFHLRPLYSLSGLTARTAGILLLVGYIIAQQAGTHGTLTSDPYALRISWLFMLISMVFFSLLAVAVFFVPLLGLHHLLLREKERLQAEADSRLQAHIRELHRRIDARQLEDADAIHKHLASLALERDILIRLPTWPWQPGTLNIILTAVLLPIILWFLQQLLERWAGF